MFLVNDGLFEHFLINKVHENVEIREIENIQIPFRTHGNVLFRTCYRMCTYESLTHPFLPKILNSFLDNMVLTEDDIDDMTESRLYSLKKYNAKVLLQETEKSEVEADEFFGDDEEDDSGPGNQN